MPTRQPRTYDVRPLAEQYGTAGPAGSWHARAAAMFITTDGPRLLREVEPVAAAAGLRVRLVTRRGRRLLVNRTRIGLLPWVRLYWPMEDWTAYSPSGALATLRLQYRWDRDDAEAEQRWTRLSEGQQVFVWDPVWGRGDRLWRVLQDCGLPTCK